MTVAFGWVAGAFFEVAATQHRARQTRVGEPNSIACGRKVSTVEQCECNGPMT